MFMIDFRWTMLGNVEGLFPFVLLHAWAWACLRGLDSCIHRSVLEALRMWGWACIRGVLSAYVGLDLCTRDAWQRPYFTHFHFSFNCFTSICNPNTTFHHFCIWTSLNPSFYLYSCIENIIFHLVRLNQEFNVIFFFCSPHPLMLVGEALIRWWSGITSLFLKQGLTSENRV